MSNSEYPYAAQLPEHLEQFGAEAEADLCRPKLPLFCEPRVATALGWLMLLVPGLALANLSLMPVGETVDRGAGTELVLVAIIGVVVAEAALLPAAMALGLGTILLRAVVCLLLAYGLCAAWLLGLVAMAWQQAYPQPIQPHWWVTIEQVATGVALWLPAALIVYQAPLWVLKVYFGWKLVRSDNSAERPARAPTIADYLRIMVVIGVALALARWHAAGQESGQVIIIFLIFGAGGTMACLLGVVPVMLLLLRLRNWRWGLAGLFAYCLVLSLLLLAIQVIIAGHAGWLGWYECLLTITPVLTWAGTLAACAGIVRVAGYRLQTGRTEQAAAVRMRTQSQLS